VYLVDLPRLRLLARGGQRGPGVCFLVKVAPPAALSFWFEWMSNVDMWNGGAKQKTRSMDG
jgi:hypothetical protein